MTNDIQKPASLTRHDSDDASDRSVDVNRREFMARSAMLGVAAAAGKVYAGPEHRHQAQQPQPLEL
jgi:ribosomal protein L13